MRRVVGFVGRGHWGLLLGGVPLLALLIVGCGKKVKEDPILRLSADEALDQGRELMEAGKYARAGQFLAHAFEVAPNSATGREALLLSADALYLDGGTANYIKAEAKYRDFRNRFPTSDRSDYVQMQLANCLAEQMLKPDRDQTATRKALAAFEELLQLYPTSDYTEQARARIVDIRQSLAEHEFVVGHYNYRRKLYQAAVSRLESLVEEFPDYAELDRALYLLGMAHRKLKEGDEAAAIFERLRVEHSESPFVQKIPADKGK